MKLCGHRQQLGTVGNSYDAQCMKPSEHEGKHGMYFGTDREGEALRMEWDDAAAYFALVDAPPGLALCGKIPFGMVV